MIIRRILNLEKSIDEDEIGYSCKVTKFIDKLSFCRQIRDRTVSLDDFRMKSTFQFASHVSKGKSYSIR